jgi:glycosyltransferase involved in cell wall biosynthesis
LLVASSRGHEVKVLLLTNIPTPYNIPVFARIARDSGWVLNVCYVSGTNKDAGWPGELLGSGAEYETLMLSRQGALRTKLPGKHLVAGGALLACLNDKKPDYIIVFGYSQIPQVIAIVWAIATATPFAVLGDANVYADCAVGIKRLVKRHWLSHVMHKASALITVGTANRMFWESYGAPPDKLFHAPFAVDNDYFARTGAARRTEASALLERMGMAGKTVFIYVGRLVRSKRVDLLIRAAAELADENVGLIVVGEGPERRALHNLAHGAQNIAFAGGIANADLPVYYAMADALVLPSDREPWGLVVNEAMASGLAIIAHRHCGATVDLVGKDNGVVLESFSVDELVEAMHWIASNAQRRQQMQSRSRQTIQHWSAPGFASGIIHAVESSACR